MQHYEEYRRIRRINPHIPAWSVLKYLRQWDYAMYPWK